MENKNLTFEQANELLEKTVSKMESGELTLEQTMEEYAKACELLAYCMKHRGRSSRARSTSRQTL